MNRLIPTFFVLSVLFIAACSSDPAVEPQAATETPATLRGVVELAIEQDRYEDALTALAAADSTAPERTDLLFAAHLTYGRWIMNNQNTQQMGQTMPQALRHLRRAQQLFPGEPQSLELINLIEGIYKQMNRPIPEGVAAP
jgi:hypothetical protein